MKYFTKNNNLYRSLAKDGTPLDSYRHNSLRWESILQWEHTIFKLEHEKFRVPDLYVILRGVEL